MDFKERRRAYVQRARQTAPQSAISCINSFSGPAVHYAAPSELKQRIVIREHRVPVLRSLFLDAMYIVREWMQHLEGLHQLYTPSTQARSLGEYFPRWVRMIDLR